MRVYKKIIFLSLTIGLFILQNSIAFAEEEIQKTFDKKKEIEIKCVLGGCEILKSKDNKIHVDLIYSYDEEDFKAEFEERGDKLVIEEEIYGNNSNGHSHWKIYIPDGMEVDFESATGGLTVEGVDADLEGSSGTGSMTLINIKGEYEVSSGTGSVKLSDSEGEFELSSGTGRIRIEDSKGIFEGSSGTGSVKAENIIIEDEADFSSGTGSVNVTLIKGKDFELNLGSGTGSVELDLGGKKIDGYYEFTTNARNGKIDSPYKFDNEEEFWEGNAEKVKKSFTIGKSATRIYLSSGTGRVKLEK